MVSLRPSGYYLRRWPSLGHSWKQTSHLYNSLSQNERLFLTLLFSCNGIPLISWMIPFWLLSPTSLLCGPGSLLHDRLLTIHLPHLLRPGLPSVDFPRKLLTLPFFMPHDTDKGLDILLDGFQCNRHYTFTLVKTASYFVSFYLATEPTIVTGPFELNKSLPAWCCSSQQKETEFG